MESQNHLERSDEEISAEKLCNLVLGKIILSTAQNALQDRIMMEMQVGEIRIYQDHKDGAYLLLQLTAPPEKGNYKLKCLERKNSHPNN